MKTGQITVKDIVQSFTRHKPWPERAGCGGNAEGDHAHLLHEQTWRKALSAWSFRK